MLRFLVVRTLRVPSYSSGLRSKKSEESNRVAVVFRCCCGLVIMVPNSMKNLYVSGSQMIALADTILFSWIKFASRLGT